MSEKVNNGGNRKKMSSKLKYSVVSLFTGAGGMDKGFSISNFNIIWANDYNKDAVATYKKNIGEHIVLGDIREIESKSIPNNPDVIIGGFPCQGFSVNNTKRSMCDERNYLYKELLRVVKDKKPKVFVAENVKGLLSMEKGKVLEMIINDFKELGYKVDYKLLNAVDYGVPQNRERVIIIGNRLGVDNIFPQKTHTGKGEVGLLPYVSVEEAISHLRYERLRECEFEIGNRRVVNHIASEKVSDKFWGRKYNVNQEEICEYLRGWRKKAGYSVKEIDKYLGYKHTASHWFRKDKYGSIPTPSDWWELKRLLKFDSRYDKEVTELEEKEITFEQTKRITNWAKPSATITASLPAIHIDKQRRLSVRECAILQTFPDDFIFIGSLNSQYRQVGNAVPVMLAQRIAEGVGVMLESRVM